MSVTTVAMIGAGNVAWSLAPAIDALPGYRVAFVASAGGTSAAALASALESAGWGTPAQLPAADIYIMCVADDAIAPLASALAPAASGQALWVHTSGSVSASALSPLGPCHGVLYPLQTFSRGRAVDLSRVPLFIEGSTPEACTALRRLAGQLSAVKVSEAGSELRRRLHIAAVFGCNFTNHLLAIAERLLQADGLPLEVLRPLLDETLAKAFASSPLEGQTGPARRGDRRVIDAHLKALQPADAALYQTLTRSIMQTYGIADAPNDQSPKP